MWHTIEKLLTRVTTLLWTSFQSEVCTQRYGPPKLWKSQFWEFRDSQLRIPWLGTKYNIMGKVVISPKSRPWWVLWVRVCPWFVCAPKCFNYTLTNLLFGLCRFVWVIELFINLPSPISELQHTLLPPKCCKLGSAPQLLLFPLSSPLDSQLSPSRSLGVHHLKSLFKYSKSIRTLTLEVKVHFGVWRFIPSHLPTFLGTWNVILGLHSWPAPLQALALFTN